ncbi:MAG: fused MFS/spermidine synthase, partial [Candidatus Eiseniibacteriota bacterium]
MPRSRPNRNPLPGRPIGAAPGRTPSRGPSRRLLLYGCFFASGSAGLILEVVWSKYLSFLLGNSIYGVSTVVAAFLGGLGIGAAVGGRFAARAKEPLLLYARLELIVAALGLATPFAYHLAQPLFAALNALFLGHGTAFLFLRFLVLFVALLIPTTAMGATLPLLVSDRSRRDPKTSARAVARLYAINTAGAVAGVAVAGFFAIPALGLWRTAALAAAIDLSVVAAIWIARPSAPPAVEGWGAGLPGGTASVASRVPKGNPAPHPSPVGASPGRWILPVFAISGFTAILYEVAWTRILAVPFGGMVYAFSAILAIYLIGIAAGAAVATRLLRRVGAAVVLFGALQALLATAVVLGTKLFERLPYWQAEAIAWSMGSTAKLLWAEAGIAARIILPPALVLGALFPTAVAVYQRRGREAGASVGAVYAANTVGSIAGSLATAFVLIPWIGTLHSILLACVLNAAIAVGSLLVGEGPALRRRLAAGAVLVSAVAFGLFAQPKWNPERMSLGLVRLLRSHWFGGASLTRRTIDRISTSNVETLLFYKEGRVAAVTVLETAGRRALLINGKTDATTGVGEDMAQQVMVGQMPLLLAPGAKDVCVVGYGSGVTTRAVLTHDVRDVLTVELEGAVIEAAPYFREDAGDPLA